MSTNQKRSRPEDWTYETQPFEYNPPTPFLNLSFGDIDPDFTDVMHISSFSPDRNENSPSPDLDQQYPSTTDTTDYNGYHPDGNSHILETTHPSYVNNINQMERYLHSSPHSPHYGQIIPGNGNSIVSNPMVDTHFTHQNDVNNLYGNSGNQNFGRVVDMNNVYQVEQYIPPQQPLSPHHYNNNQVGVVPMPMVQQQIYRPIHQTQIYNPSVINYNKPPSPHNNGIMHPQMGQPLLLNKSIINQQITDQDELLLPHQPYTSYSPPMNYPPNNESPNKPRARSTSPNQKTSRIHIYGGDKSIDLDNNFTKEDNDIKFDQALLRPNTQLNKGSEVETESIFVSTISLPSKNSDIDQLENKINLIKQMIRNKNYNLDGEIKNVREDLGKLMIEYDQKITTNFLKPIEFYDIERKMEKIKNLFLPTLSVIEQDIAYCQGKLKEPPCHISILSQESAGPVPKDKPIGQITLQMICGPSLVPLCSNPVQPILVDQQRQRGRKINVDNNKGYFKDGGSLTFNDISFSSGTHPNFVPLKFRTDIELVDSHGKRNKRTIESDATKPYVSMTNNGSQWVDSAGNWLKIDCFGEKNEVSIEKFCNYFQKHVIIATKQELSNPERILIDEDFQYIVGSKIQNKKTISVNEAKKIWDWIGIGIKKIRFQKNLQPLYTKGFFPAFVSKEESEVLLKDKPLGTFIVRLSASSSQGDIVISYAQNENTCKHYLIQQDDTADKKKTLADFIGNKNSFKTIYTVNVDSNGKRAWVALPKDKVLKGFYKKKIQKPKDSMGYDDTVKRLGEKE